MHSRKLTVVTQMIRDILASNASAQSSWSFCGVENFRSVYIENAVTDKHNWCLPSWTFDKKNPYLCERIYYYLFTF